MSEAHEHLEQAEHVGHHGSDPFNQRVAVSMAIVAACLAGISMIGHRTHNKVLEFQGDSNRLRTEAATAEVEKSNLFAWYQAKKVRQAQYELSAKMVALIPGGDTATQTKLSKEWKDKAEGYDKSNDKKDNLPDLDEQGKAAGNHAEELKAKARTARDESEHVEHQADRLDIAHLLAEVALVLCSITLLTKRKMFWYLGILAAVIAIGLTISAYTIPHEAPHEAKTHA
jgi:Domain of unknown function (DUF4337)